MPLVLPGLPGTAASSGPPFSVTSNGRVSYDTSTVSASFAASLTALALGETMTDSFIYAIRLANGTLSWAKASELLTGVNDTPQVQAVALLAVEVSGAVTGNFHGDDVDSDDDGSTLIYTIIGSSSVGTLVNDDVYQINGVITLPGKTIDVTYTGQTYINSSPYVNYWRSSSNIGMTWDNAGTGVYTSTEAPNGPGSFNTDYIALSNADSPRNLTFSEPVENLFFAVSSMNNNGYLFDQPFTVVSSADGPNDRGNWGYASGYNLPVSSGQYGISTQGFAQTEFHGVLAINNAVDTLTWRSQADETWNGFTVGTYGVAHTTTAAGNVLAKDDLGNGIPTTVTAAGGSAITGNSVTLNFASGAILRVDMNAESGGGYVEQTLQTIVGVQYTVNIALSKNPGSPTNAETPRVSATGNSSQDYAYNQPNSAAVMKWVKYTYTFTATGSSTVLRLGSTDPTGGSDAWGPALDEVLAVNNQIINGFDKVLGDKLDLNSLLGSVNAPHDATAFSLGFLNFQASGSDTVVRVDADGGGDNYLEVATLVGVSLLSTDTGNFIL